MFLLFGPFGPFLFQPGLSGLISEKNKNQANHLKYSKRGE
jgi:hypothetical protein